MPAQIVAAAIAAAAALIGAAIAANDRAKAQQIREDLAKQIGEAKLPVLDRLVASKLSPEEGARWMRSTQATQTQGKVLGKVNEIIDAKGETPEDRAAYLRMQNEAGGISNAANSAVDRDMAARGLSGSGMDFALKQQGAQSAINAANASGLQAASDASGRYTQALQMGGQMAGQARGQDQDAMRAQDAMNMFNARQQTEADRYNAGVPQQNFDNQMSLETLRANAKNGVASGYERSADKTQQTAAGVANAAATMGGYESEGALEGEPTRKKYKSSAGSK